MSMLDTLANVKSRLGITTSADDTFLTQQITFISDVIEAYCRRKFNEADYIQTFYEEDNKPAKRFSLFHYPVSEVSSIEADDVVLDSATYRLHGEFGYITARRGTSFFCVEETVVEYTAGFASGEMPTPILSVLDSLVQERYNKYKSGVSLNFGADVQRVSIPGVMSIDFDYSLSNNERTNAFGSILGSTMNVLDSYRSERAIVGSDTLHYVEEV